MVGIGAAVVMVVALLIVLTTMRGCLKGPPAGPELAYECPACDAAWEQPRKLGADCPKCGELGCTSVHAQCRACKHEFKAWQSRQLGPGKFEHRLVGSDGDWLSTAPPLTCPKCKRKGEFAEGGAFFNPAASGSAEPAEPVME